MSHPAPNRTALWILVAACAALTALHAWRFWPFLADDALISLRYSMRLLEGHGLTWTEGTRVEGYSNFSWVLLAAGLGALGMDLIDASRVLGFATACFGSGITAWAIARRGGAPALFGGAAAGLFLALAPPTAVWAIGGLETPLVAACLCAAWAILWPRDGSPPTAREQIVASLPLAVLVWTRPDGPLFTALASAWLFFHGGRPTKESFHNAARLAIIPFLFFGAQMAFRMGYYGEFIPNTARAKISGSDRHFEQGMAYVGRFLRSSAPLAAAAIATFLLVLAGRPARLRDSRRAVLLVGTPALAWAWYTCYIGGDIFPAYRHGIPILVAMAFLAGEGVRLLADADASGWRRPAPFAAILAILLGAHFAVGSADESNKQPLTERWEWDGQVVGLMLKRGFAGKEPLLAVDAAGTTPYFSEFPCVDMLGLNDYYLARNKPNSFGRRRIGHELGEGNYVLRREPDIVAFGYNWTQHAYERGAQEMQNTAEFARRYRWCTFAGADPYRYDFGVFIRHDSRKIGVERSAAGIAIPCYFFTPAAAPRTQLDAEHRFFIEAKPDSQLSAVGIPIPAGRWRLEIEPPESADVVKPRVMNGDAELMPLTPAKDAVLVVPSDRMTLTIELRAERSAVLRKLTLRPAP